MNAMPPSAKKSGAISFNRRTLGRTNPRATTLGSNTAPWPAATFLWDEAHVLAGLKPPIVEYKTALIKQKWRIRQLLKWHSAILCRRVIRREQCIQRLIAKGWIGENLIVGCQATALKQLHIDVRITASVLGRQAGEQGITGQQWQPQLQLAAR